MGGLIDVILHSVQWPITISKLYNLNCGLNTHKSQSWSMKTKSFMFLYLALKVYISHINSNKLQSFRVTFNYLRNVILRVLFSKKLSKFYLDNTRHIKHT